MQIMARALGLFILLCGNGMAAVLPEERADALYHSYYGGGVEVTGPSYLVRKNFGETVSITANYYLDQVSSASIDVLTSASPYDDERTQTSFSIDYLRDRTILNLSRTQSDESDFKATTYHFGISQDVFGDLTTISMGYAIGSDSVGKSNDSSFSEDVDRRQYSLGISQILSSKLIVSVDYEGIIDEGFLNNPYRSVRYLDSSSATGYSFESEIYPNTRISNALAVRARYFLPYRAAVYGEYRRYNDSWEIDADTWLFGYVHPWRERWVFEGRYRRYSQSAAEFYSDLFPRIQAQNFLARDKELSTFDSNTIGVTVSYEWDSEGWQAIDRLSLNLAYDHIRFDYRDFRDLRVNATPGTEPLYDFTANVVQLYVSVWF